MRKIIFMLLFILPGFANAQKLPDYGFYKVRINEAGITILAEIEPVNLEPKAKPDHFYFWYSANHIHSTQGGFSGKLLNGMYTEYFANKNLKEKGSFRNGLKNGAWKSWNEDGSLLNSSVWKNGLIVHETSLSFWQRINIFKKRGKQAPVDSSAKPKVKS